jgi:hypothetical protein
MYLWVLLAFPLWDSKLAEHSASRSLSLPQGKITKRHSGPGMKPPGALARGFWPHTFGVHVLELWWSTFEEQKLHLEIGKSCRQGTDGGMLASDNQEPE